MKNVTISMDEELLRLTRIEAAKAGLSMSKFLAEAAQEKLRRTAAEDSAAERKRKVEAMERFLSGPKLHIAVDGKMPTSDERNARR